jgi:riboflavin synthase
MFTGIIETTARLIDVVSEGTNVHSTVESDISDQLKVDQSVAHNGVCLTVTAVSGNTHTVTAVEETINKTTLGTWAVGKLVNLERALKAGDRLDGHFVQGHVDTTGRCTEVTELDGSWLYRFSFPGQFAALIIEKGSICINGVSLTVFNVGRDAFTVTIIPYTYNHTSFSQLMAGDAVNLEFDVLGKYILRMEELKSVRQ